MDRLLITEILALLVAVLGIGLLSIPAALIVFGVAVIVACERHDQPDAEDGERS